MIPESVKILSHNYRVVQDLDPATSKYYGFIDHNAGVIRLSQELIDTLLRRTIVHEVVHAIDVQLDLGLTEAQVTALGTCVDSFIIDNPGFVRYV